MRCHGWRPYVDRALVPRRRNGVFVVYKQLLVDLKERKKMYQTSFFQLSVTSASSACARRDVACCAGYASRASLCGHRRGH